MTASRHSVRDGVVVGLIGYAAVAVFYSVFDLLAARGTLFTVDLLGKALFRGLRDPSVLYFPVEPDMTVVLMYNAIHLVTALAIGMIVTRLVKYAEENPSRRPFAVFVIVAGFFVTVAAIGYLTVPIRPLVPFWSIVLANALAVVLAAGYLLRKRPEILRILGRTPPHFDGGAPART